MEGEARFVGMRCGRHFLLPVPAAASAKRLKFTKDCFSDEEVLDGGAWPTVNLKLLRKVWVCLTGLPAVCHTVVWRLVADTEKTGVVVSTVAGAVPGGCGSYGDGVLSTCLAFVAC